MAQTNVERKMEIIENSRVNELNRLGISNREKVDNHIKQHENVFTTSKTSKPHVFKKKKGYFYCSPFYPVGRGRRGIFSCSWMKVRIAFVRHTGFVLSWKVFQTLRLTGNSLSLVRGSPVSHHEMLALAVKGSPSSFFLLLLQKQG